MGRQIEHAPKVFPATGKPAIGKAALAKAESMTEGQRAYEARRAAKAGMTLDRWLEQKRRAEAAEAVERARTAKPAAPRKQGLISRLIERAHKPLS